MRITAEADAYLERYGAETGLQKLKSAGYDAVSLCIRDMHRDPNFASLSEAQLKERFSPLREALDRLEMKLSFVIADRDIYSSKDPGSSELRKQWCLQTVRIAAVLGSSIAVVRPAPVSGEANARARSKEILLDVLSAMEAEGKPLGVRPAGLNTCQPNAYGNRLKELAELAETTGAGILFDPAAAYLLHERVPGFTTFGYWDAPTSYWDTEEEQPWLSDALSAYLIGIRFNDTERTIGNPELPLSGVLDYRTIVKALENRSDDLYLSVDCRTILKRYHDLLRRDSFTDELTAYYCRLAKAVGRKGAE